MIRRAQSPDGVIHTRPAEEKRRPERLTGQADADVCLRCTEVKCRGTAKCVKRRKAEQERKEEEI